mmetsp:Transcript_43160/g.63469  ORF Transcript_43160/g.63469 Transcript_43160/m.63469 type:complete len:221 (+) Transcript_43160:245-907(+)
MAGKHVILASHRRQGVRDPVQLVVLGGFGANVRAAHARRHGRPAGGRCFFPPVHCGVQYDGPEPANHRYRTAQQALRSNQDQDVQVGRTQDPAGSPFHKACPHQGRCKNVPRAAHIDAGGSGPHPHCQQAGYAVFHGRGHRHAEADLHRHLRHGLQRLWRLHLQEPTACQHQIQAAAYQVSVRACRPREHLDAHWQAQAASSCACRRAGRRGCLARNGQR